MALVTIEINDNETMKFLMQIISSLDNAAIIDSAPKNDEIISKRERILSFAGSWSDMPDDEWQQLASIIQRDRPFFSDRDVSW